VTLFCPSVYEEGRGFALAVSHGIVLASVAGLFVLVWKFNSKKHLFPIRERAPRVAVVQSLTYLILMTLLYLIEIGLALGLFDWKGESYEEVKPWRKVMKGVYLSVRINIYNIFLLRYALLRQHRCALLRLERLEDSRHTPEPANSRRIFRVCLWPGAEDALHGKKLHLRRDSAHQLIMVWLPLCSVAFYFDTDSLVTGYSSLDWYTQGMNNNLSSMWLGICSGATLHIFEVIVMFFGFYVHRHFPAEFSLSKEILLNLLMGWVVDWVTSLSNALSPLDNENPCILDTLTVSAVLDLTRCFTFVTIIYIITIKSFAPFPLPFTWVFRDFTKFIFEPQCVSVFVHYLRAKEPNKLELMNKVMKLYVTEFDKERESNASNSSDSSKKLSHYANANTIFMSGFSPVASPTLAPETNRQLFLDALVKLEPSFNNYKKTRSAQTLIARLKEFEEITEKSS